MIKRILIGLVALVVIAYVGFIVALYVLQRDFQYDKSGRLFDLSETTLTADTTVVSIPSAEGSQLTGWYQAPQTGKPVILYFRGNAQSFSREHERFEQWTTDGYGFLAFDYRGFPGLARRDHRGQYPRRWARGLRLAQGEGLPRRPLGPFARLRPRDLGRQGARGGRAVPRDAVRLRCLGRGRSLRLRAGRSPDEGPVPCR